ncbi:LytR/AlgR family response regulator transcription factor [Sediminitomix flava]|uniref:LytTr DNA-binding domain-containing protein n=1 Tax=Sediminitomix flava TaxID=379075 RepID=A0A315Z7D4_SEDFL|nr:LytTR family DNA-binding domain-containing protein [Sediminitomix flava]PWJ40054.1 LytTr DNA-binding domain-containing protein [Sediminitomix flava]
MTILNFQSKDLACLKTPFTLLDDNKSKVFFILFCGGFSSFFIYFFNPFNIQRMNYEDAFAHFLSISNAGIIAALILGITHFFIRRLFRATTFRLWQFLLWVIFDFTCLCTACLFLFGEFDEPLLHELKIVVRYTLSLGMLPYSLACLLIAVYKLSTRKPKEIAIPKIEEKTSIDKQFLFKEKSGKVALAVKPEQILYLKSENNYTMVVYLENDEVIKKLVRTNLKQLEKEIRFPKLIRIHRSFMLNLDAMSSFEKVKGGYQIQINQIPNTCLKVSESYRTEFESFLT